MNIQDIKKDVWAVIRGADAKCVDVTDWGVYFKDVHGRKSSIGFSCPPEKSPITKIYKDEIPIVEKETYLDKYGYKHYVVGKIQQTDKDEWVLQDEHGSIQRSYCDNLVSFYKGKTDA